MYAAAEKRIAKRLNNQAQVISDTKLAHDSAAKWEERFAELEGKLNDGGIERAELKTRTEELHKAQQELDRECKDREIVTFVRRVAQKGRALQKRLDEAKGRKDSNREISDLAQELHMTSQARKVYTIIMEALEYHFQDDKDMYYNISGVIKQALKKRF